MLNIKYIEEFKAGDPYLVVTSDKQGFLNACNFFRNKPGGFLNDKSITGRSDLGALQSSSLYLTPEECVEIADHFKNVVSSGKPQHAYFDIKALPDIEIIISYLEYDDLFQM
jgi:hypothetical protein